MAATLTVLGGCAAEDARPPEVFHGSPPENLRSCADIERHGEPAGGRVAVDGGLASCPAVGQQCPLADRPAFAATCAPDQLAFATCVAGTWTATCASVDAAARDSTAPVADAAPDPGVD